MNCPVVLELYPVTWNSTPALDLTTLLVSYAVDVELLGAYVDVASGFSFVGTGVVNAGWSVAITTLWVPALLLPEFTSTAVPTILFTSTCELASGVTSNLLVSWG